MYFKKLFNYLIIMGFLFGCSPKTNLEIADTITTDSISSKQVTDILNEAKLFSEFFGGEIILDKEYGLPTEKWIETYLYPEFWKKFNTQYILESNDCDDFVAHARSEAQRLNNLTSNRGKRALAFGECHYIKDSGVHHAINFAIIKNKENYKIIFFEPQNGFVIQLSENERNRIWFWMI